MKYELLKLCVYLTFSLLMVDSISFAATDANTVSAIDSHTEKSWWQKRQQNKDLYYPHQIHMQAMDEEGDSCMLCHTFSANNIINEKQLRRITTIANEPLKAICHDCHLEEVRAPWRCNICHTDKTAIWPDDHNYDYIHQHNEDARLDEKKCRSCHVEIAFCSNCHFRRGGGQADYHPMGYQSRHGIDARFMPSQCGRCHNSFYCSDCHRNKK